MEFCAIESCGKCTPCRIGSTRGVEVIDRILEGLTASATCGCWKSCGDHGAGIAVRAGRHGAVPVQSALKHFREDFRGR